MEAMANINRGEKGIHSKKKKKTKQIMVIKVK